MTIKIRVTLSGVQKINPQDWLAEFRADRGDPDEDELEDGDDMPEVDPDELEDFAIDRLIMDLESGEMDIDGLELDDVSVKKV